MPGILEDIFCGVEGVDKFLHDTLGGTAVITHVAERTFNETSGQWTSENSDFAETVAFIPLPYEAWNEDVRRCFLEANDKIAGTVPMCDLTVTVVPDRDTVTYCGETYVIRKVEYDPVQNDVDHITLYGTK